MIFVYWTNYIQNNNKLSSTQVKMFIKALDNSGFIKEKNNHGFTFVKPLGFRRGVQPIFHIQLEKSLKIFSRPHLGGLIPITVFSSYIAYIIFLRHFFVPEQKFFITGVFFFGFILGTVNLVHYLMFHSDVLAFEKELSNVYNNT